ncbi:MAG: SRPBCC domain-containing protein [Anaerolineales bacterium]
MSRDFEVSITLPASPQEVYDAWLDSKGHSKMTGAKAKVSNKVGGTFEAWDGYIRGKNLILEPGKRIVQAWRTVEFSDDEEDSQIDITFAPAAKSTRLTLRHTRLPAHGEQYRQGWVDNYFDPMKAYFKG